MLAIVSKDDFPIFQQTLPSQDFQGELYLNEFVLHSSLDFVEKKMFWTNQIYLKQVDAHKDSLVSAFLTAGNDKFLLLHSGKTGEDTIKQFFLELYDLYVKTMMNPFYEPNTKINFPAFDKWVKELTNKYL